MSRSSQGALPPASRLYLATLVGSDTFILVFGGLASFMLGPAFWVWTGSALRR